LQPDRRQGCLGQVSGPLRAAVNGRERIEQAPSVARPVVLDGRIPPLADDERQQDTLRDSGTARDFTMLKPGPGRWLDAPPIWLVGEHPLPRLGTPGYKLVEERKILGADGAAYQLALWRRQR
jgi:hypothetical protein